MGSLRQGHGSWGQLELAGFSHYEWSWPRTKVWVFNILRDKAAAVIVNEASSLGPPISPSAVGRIEKKESKSSGLLWCFKVGHYGVFAS